MQMARNPRWSTTYCSEITAPDKLPQHIRQPVSPGSYQLSRQRGRSLHRSASAAADFQFQEMQRGAAVLDRYSLTVTEFICITITVMRTK